MTCPTCQTKTQVIDSRSRDGEVYRRRCCKNGHRFSTLERVEFILPERCRETRLHPFPSMEAAILAAKGDGSWRNAFECRHCNAWHLTPVEKTDTSFQQT